MTSRSNTQEGTKHTTTRRRLTWPTDRASSASDPFEDIPEENVDMDGPSPECSGFTDIQLDSDGVSFPVGQSSGNSSNLRRNQPPAAGVTGPPPLSDIGYIIAKLREVAECRLPYLPRDWQLRLHCH